MSPEISVIISTFNRQQSLSRTIDSLLEQQDAPPYEIVIVDNRSTDTTAATVHLYSARDERVRYIYEPRQGVSYGRNAGIRNAIAPILAFTDDDIVPDRDWLAQISLVFRYHPDTGCIGGKVLPKWQVPPPAWLTPEQWSPLALLDYGEPQSLDRSNPKCLITANVAIRREVFTQIGDFQPAFQKIAGALCGIEDRELQERYWQADGKCWFDPKLIVYADVQPDRLTKEYHRRWHFKHGEMLAILRDPQLEASRLKFLGAPGHIWRRLVTELLDTVGCAVIGSGDAAFTHELQARSFAGFIRQRIKDKNSPPAEL
jgi:glycosyltransferase involved in cell wall biosynthesis